MKLNEVIPILVKRIGFESDGTISGAISSDNTTTLSGRFFQDEHSAVTLQNIRECQPVSGISDLAFQLYLERLKEKAVRRVLTDAFEKDYIDDDVLSAYETIFDNAIACQMTIIVSDIITSSVRINNIERLTDSFIRKLNYDIFREASSGSKNVSRYALGITTRYGFEIKALQRRFGQQRNLLKTITKGDTIPNWEEIINEDLE